MNKIILLVLAACTLHTSIAQKTFDSAAYVQFYHNYWEQPHYSMDTTEVHLSIEEKIAGLGKAWAEARFNFANFDLIAGTNWDSLYQAYIPRVVAAPNTDAYYKVLQQFYQHLRDGHTTIYQPARYWQKFAAVLPLELRWVEGKVLVVKNLSPKKEDAHIKPGMEVVKFAEQPILEYIKKEISPYLSFSTPQDSTERIYRYELTPGIAGSSETLELRTPAGKTFTHTLQRILVQQMQQRYPLASFTVLKGNIGYLTLNSFNDTGVVRIFVSLFAQISKTDALVIDIRNNGGGNGQNGFEILGCLAEQAFYTGKTAIRKYMPVGRAWNNPETIDISGWDWKPYKEQLYAKPVVLLTGAATYSAAEDFTSAFRSINRGKVFGQPTGGSTGQPVSFNLPGGGGGRVCAKRDYLWDGTEFVGIGIAPDVLVTPTMKGIAAERDEVLDAAVQYVSTQKNIAVK